MSVSETHCQANLSKSIDAALADFIEFAPIAQRCGIALSQDGRYGSIDVAMALLLRLTNTPCSTSRRGAATLITKRWSDVANTGTGCLRSTADTADAAYRQPR